jgi:hypothetical protein
MNTEKMTNLKKTIDNLASKKKINFKKLDSELNAQLKEIKEEGLN